MGRLLLIVSLWQAPVPIVHSHGADLSDPFQSVALAQHLAEYHPDVPVNSHDELGWHCHLVFLGDPLMDEPSDSDGRPDRSPAFDPFITNVAEAGPAVALAVEWQTCAGLRAMQLSGLELRLRPAAPSRFLDTYLQSVPLRTLLRVARC
jgi:hypothetical protein